MKIKFGELMRIFPSLDKVSDATYLNLKSIYGAGRAINQIQQEFNAFEKKRRQWYKEFGEKVQVPDPKDPKKLIDHPRGDMRIKKEHEAKWEELRKGYEELEIELYDFKLYLSDLVANSKLKDVPEDKKFSITDISNLMPWLIDDLPQEVAVKEEEIKEAKKESSVPDTEPANQC